MHTLIEMLCEMPTWMFILLYMLLPSVLIILLGYLIAYRNHNLYIREQTQKMNRLFGDTGTITPIEFFEIRKSCSAITGIYVLYNQTKNMYYVGQAQNVFRRVTEHFTGHGNGDVYADYKYGNSFTIRIIKLDGSGYDSLDALEKDTIDVCNAYYQGYNKTRGNGK